MKNALEVLRSRRSIRTYAQKPVEKSIIEEIVDCGRLAPTANNDQPWEFVVLTSKEKMASLPPMLGHAEYLANAAFVILVLARPTQYAVEDSCAATENLLLAAEAHGIGSCWVAGTQQPYAPKVAAAFGAPADHQLIALCSFGYPAEEVTIEKRTLSSVLHWEKF